MRTLKTNNKQEQFAKALIYAMATFAVICTAIAIVQTLF